MMGILLLFVINLIVLFFLLIIFRKEGYLHPTIVVSFYWFFYIFIALIVIKKFNYYFSWTSLIPIYALLLSYILGGLYFKIKYPFIYNDKNINKLHEVLKYKLTFILIVCFSSIGLVGTFMHLSANGYSDVSVLTINKYANQMSILRYSSGLITPKIVMICYAFNYVGAILSGAYFSIKSKRLFKIIVLLPIFTGLLIAFSSGSRAGFIILLSLWFAGYISASINVGSGRFKNMRRVILYGSIVLFLLIAFFSLIQYFRGGSAGDYTIFKFARKMAGYSFGQISAFSQWWQGYELKELGLGKYNFAGIFDIFFDNRKAGIFSKVTIISDKGNATNIHTIFRGLIQDFGLLGNICFSLFSGFFSSYFYRKLKKGSIVGFTFIVIIYSVLLWSLTTNILNYNVVILSFIILFISLNILTFRYSMKFKGRKIVLGINGIYRNK